MQSPDTRNNDRRSIGPVTAENVAEVVVRAGATVALLYGLAIGIPSMEDPASGAQGTVKPAAVSANNFENANEQNRAAEDRFYPSGVTSTLKK